MRYKHFARGDSFCAIEAVMASYAMLVAMFSGLLLFRKVRFSTGSLAKQLGDAKVQPATALASMRGNVPSASIEAMAVCSILSRVWRGSFGLSKSNATRLPYPSLSLCAQSGMVNVGLLPSTGSYAFGRFVFIVRGPPWLVGMLRDAVLSRVLISSMRMHHCFASILGGRRFSAESGSFSRKTDGWQMAGRTAVDWTIGGLSVVVGETAVHFIASKRVGRLRRNEFAF